MTTSTPKPGSRNCPALVVSVFALGSLGCFATIVSSETSVLVLVAMALVVLTMYAAAEFSAFVQQRQKRFTDLQERASRAEEAVDTTARLAVVQERTRIAREMHDIVAHGISVISVQAAAGQAIALGDPDRAVTIFADIEDTGREALAEMRRMLGVLRSGDRLAVGLAPQPSLHNLDDAIEHCVHAGLPVELTITGEPDRLSPGIELAAYRIIQEALTNALKHGGDATTAAVLLDYDPASVAITITDTGRGAVSSLSSTGSGNGILGMKERVDAYHGDFFAGPKTGGGYEVRARFPLGGRFVPGRVTKKTIRNEGIPNTMTTPDRDPELTNLTPPGNNRTSRRAHKTPALAVLLIAAIALLTPSVALAAGTDDTSEDSAHRQERSTLPDEPDWFLDESSLPFEPLSIADVGATQHWGVLRGAGYRIEVPEDWNGELIMFAHGYQGEDARLFLSPAEGWIGGDSEAEFPDEFRKWMLEEGYAWAQSTYAKNAYNVTQGLLDTNRLVRHFGQNYGKPTSVYIAGFSMGGHISAVAAEQFPRIYSAAMPMCGSVGDYELFDYYLDISVAGQHLALGNSQFPAADDYTTADLPAIKDALGMNVDPDTWFEFAEFPLTEAGEHYKQLLELQSGGDRPNFDEAFIFWNSVPTETGPGNFLWEKGLGDGTITGRSQVIRDNSDVVYQVDLDPDISAFEQQLNDEIARVEPGPSARVVRGLRNPPPVTGRLRMPVLTLHNLGDLFVPFNNEIVYAQDAANQGSSDLLVQRAIRGASHCDFTPNEMIDGMSELINWAKTGERPEGDVVTDPTVVAEADYGCRFTQNDSAGHLLATPC